MPSPTLLNQQQKAALRPRADEDAPGKPTRRIAGGWIADLAALKQVIILCSFCTHKFNPGRVGYRREKEFPVAVGKCDGCGTHDLRCSWYVYEETYNLVRSTVDERRALARRREMRIKRG